MKETKQKISETIESYIVGNFSISELTTNIEVKNIPYKPIHGLTFILIFAGQGIIHTNEKDYSVKKRMLISIAPFQSYCFIEQSYDLKYEYISFELDFMADFPLILKPYIAEKMEKEPCLNTNRKTFSLFKTYYESILREYKRIDHPSRIGIIKAFLYVFIAEISYLYSQQPINTKTSHIEQITDDFLKLLHTFYRKERKPEFYADKLCMSPQHLSKILKKTTGQTLYVWICMFVIKEAKIMLHSTDMNISQISDELNFPNSSYFSRYFRKYTNMSPMQYKNTI